MRRATTDAALVLVPRPMSIYLPAAGNLQGVSIVNVARPVAQRMCSIRRRAGPRRRLRRRLVVHSPASVKPPRGAPPVRRLTFGNRRWALNRKRRVGGPDKRTPLLNSFVRQSQGLRADMLAVCPLG